MRLCSMLHYIGSLLSKTKRSRRLPLQSSHIQRERTLNGQTIKRLDAQLKQNEDVARRNILIF